MKRNTKSENILTANTTLIQLTQDVPNCKIPKQNRQLCGSGANVEFTAITHRYAALHIKY